MGDTKGKDLEAQTTPSTTDAGTGSGATFYVRSGRGGAGNFIKPTAPAEHAAKKASAIQALRTTGLTGRGGAGNYTENTAQAAARAELERRRREDLEAKVLQSVGTGLAVPQPAYLEQARRRRGER